MYVLSPYDRLCELTRGDAHVRPLHGSRRKDHVACAPRDLATRSRRHRAEHYCSLVPERLVRSPPWPEPRGVPSRTRMMASRPGWCRGTTPAPGGPGFLHARVQGGAAVVPGEARGCRHPHRDRTSSWACCTSPTASWPRRFATPACAAQGHPPPRVFGRCLPRAEASAQAGRTAQPIAGRMARVVGSWGSVWIPRGTACRGSLPRYCQRKGATESAPGHSGVVNPTLLGSAPRRRFRTSCSEACPKGRSRGG